MNRLFLLVEVSCILRHFISGAAPLVDGKNPLMDVADKWPGHTHLSFDVACVQGAEVYLNEIGINSSLASQVTLNFFLENLFF